MKGPEIALISGRGEAAKRSKFKPWHLLIKGTGAEIATGLLGLVARCRILDGRRKVLQKSQVCHRRLQIHLQKRTFLAA